MEALEDIQYFSITFPSFFLFHVFSPRLFFPEKKNKYLETQLQASKKKLKKICCDAMKVNFKRVQKLYSTVCVCLQTWQTCKCLPENNWDNF